MNQEDEADIRNQEILGIRQDVLRFESKATPKNPDKPVIFVITGVPFDYPVSSTRAFGWFPSFEEAEAAVKSNRCGMDEAGYYQWAVIEKTLSGMYAWSESETWYEYNEDNQYVNVEKPKHMGGVSWGLG
jgi:hypothetical protein